MNQPVLVVMAAGLGSRYGGLKQIDPLDAGQGDKSGNGKIHELRADRKDIFHQDGKFEFFAASLEGSPLQSQGGNAKIFTARKTHYAKASVDSQVR